MRTLASSLVLGIVLILIGNGAGAGEKKDKKEVKLTGKICCTKCELGIAKKCETVIVVTKGKKDVLYYFDAAGHKTHHAAICTAAKQGTVTGTVGKDGKKMTITVKTLEFK